MHRLRVGVDKEESALRGGVRLSRVANGGKPDRNAERDFIHEVGEVVHNVKAVIIDRSSHVPQDITDWINRPSYCDDEP